MGCSTSQVLHFRQQNALLMTRSCTVAITISRHNTIQCVQPYAKKAHVRLATKPHHAEYTQHIKILQFTFRFNVDMQKIVYNMEHENEVCTNIQQHSN